MGTKSGRATSIMQKYVNGYVCRFCGNRFSASTSFVCPKCGRTN